MAMGLSAAAPQRAHPDHYLFGSRHAWFAFAMTVALMLFDYIDRQVIVSLFPHLKLEWGLSDKQLGALVSVVSITVAIGALPIALLADRGSRVKSIFVMAMAWSLSCISCMFTRSYGPLLTARAVVGVGEAGYGSVGSALLASHFPERMRSTMMAAFFAAGSFGSVLGVMLGGIIAAHWGWRAAFGVVGVPGLVFAVLYLFVRDYRTVALPPRLDRATQSLGSTTRSVVSALTRAPTMLWVCLGTSAQVIVLSTVWAWLPSYLNRTHGLPPAKAAVSAALVVLCGAVGAMLWGAVVDRAGRRQPRNKLFTLAALCLLSMAMLMPALGSPGLALAPGLQLAWIAVGGLLMTCTAGPSVALVIDVVHPGLRSTGCAVLAFFQNMFGLAAGPFIAGALSDRWTLPVAMVIMPSFSILAALCYLLATRTYERDAKRIREQLATEAHA
ncbi:MFS transporter [Burkholderia guangdongensis]|uniref:MFS transporter n=1 Tax=Burkholderia guangdongensis TaxID=1792500 RepID=UPI001FEBC6C8|nr:MFS transporter [Burkholderia guangdongensis]